MVVFFLPRGKLFSVKKDNGMFKSDNAVTQQAKIALMINAN